MDLEKPVEAPHRGESPRSCAPRETLPFEFSEESPQPKPIYPGEVPIATVVSLAEVSEQLEVTAIGGQRIGGLALLFFEMGQVFSDEADRLTV